MPIDTSGGKGPWRQSAGAKNHIQDGLISNAPGSSAAPVVGGGDAREKELSAFWNDTLGVWLDETTYLKHCRGTENMLSTDMNTLVLGGFSKGSPSIPHGAIPRLRDKLFERIDLIANLQSGLLRVLERVVVRLVSLWFLPERMQAIGTETRGAIPIRRGRETRLPSQRFGRCQRISHEAVGDCREGLPGAWARAQRRGWMGPDTDTSTSSTSRNTNRQRRGSRRHHSQGQVTSALVVARALRERRQDI